MLALVLVAGCGGGGADTPGDGDDTRAAPAPLAPPAETGDRWPQPVRYALDLAYDARRFALAGDEEIVLRNTGPEPLARVWLRTWANAYGGCDRRFVRVAVRGGGRADGERAGCTALAVRLDAPLAPGAETAIALRVDVATPTRPDRFGRYAGAAFFGNALPVLAVAGPDGWSLPPYTFHGESFSSLSARWELALALPDGVRAATTGAERSGGGGELRAEADAARDFMIVAGPLEETARKAGGVRVRHWRLRDGADAADRALDVAARALTGFSRTYGPYGRDELDVVEGPREIAQGGLGMEYPELVLSPAVPGILAHEVAHQWWYAIVGDDEYRDPWLDESFASYAAFRLLGGFPPCPPRPWRPPLTASMAAWDRRSDRYSDIVYRGGACALRTVERGLGRGRFDAFLRGLVRDHRDGVLTSEDVVAAVGDDGLLRRAGILPP